MTSNITIDALGLNSVTWLQANDAEVSQYPKMIVGPDDCNFLLRPITGGLDNKHFTSVLKILIDNVFPRKMFKTDLTYAEILRGFTDKVYPISDRDYLKSQMASCEKAVIGKGSKVFVDLSKRDCRRITFGSSVVHDIWKLIQPNICRAVQNQSRIKVGDVRIDETHGDILFYEEGGKFDIHRDGQTEFPYGENPLDEYGKPMWVMCSVLIGLHSNLTSENILRGDGNTMVYLPDVNYARLYGSLQSHMTTPYGVGADPVNKYMEPHKFVESVIQGSYVIMPSSAKHSSLRIMQKGGFKMALKLDLWLRQDLDYKYPSADPVVFETMTIDDPYHMYQHLSRNKPNCQCNLCCPNKFARKALKELLLHDQILGRKLPEDILWYTSGFLFPDESQVSRNLPYHERHPDDSYYYTASMKCTCEECIGHTHNRTDLSQFEQEQLEVNHFLEDDGEQEFWEGYDDDVHENDWHPDDDNDDWEPDDEESFCNGYELDDYFDDD